MPACVERSNCNSRLPTVQPLSTPPTTSVALARASSNNVSLNGDAPDSSRIGLTCTPGWSISTRIRRMPVCFGLVRRGARKDEDEIRVHCIRRPDLAAVQDVVVAVAHRAQGQACEVRTRTRLGIAHRPAAVAAGDGRQPAPLLVVVAEFQQGGPDVVDAATGQRRTRVDSLQFLDQHRIAVPVEFGAAVLPRPGGHRPTALRHALEPRPQVVVEQYFAAAPGDRPGTAGTRRTVGVEPCACFGTKFG